MIFASHIFLFGFLPLFLAAYYLTPHNGKSALILLASYAFYGWWRIDFLALVVAITFASYFSAHVAITASTDRIRRYAVRAGVALILLALGYFKYALFFADMANSVGARINGSSITINAIILPIGISFLSFQAISYIIDVARKDAPPARNLIDYMAFVSLFPQLIAGPVLRYKDLADQFENRTHSLAKFNLGIRRFVEGLAMKLLIADSVAPLADRIFLLETPTMAEAWLGAGAYSIQLLFDFAGYSAMAIGLGLMIGFRFMENFDAPYTSRSITEFWRRWHISLSSWLRDYLYIPLGGNRQSALKTYRNLMLTMILGGFWHGANWTFVLWGFWHGLALSIERFVGIRHGRSIVPFGLSWLTTMIVIMIGWVMFRAPNVDRAFDIYMGMIGQNGLQITAPIHYATQSIELAALAVGFTLATLGPQLRNGATGHPALRFTATTVLLVLSTVALSARLHSPFLYFQF